MKTRATALYEDIFDSNVRESLWAQGLIALMETHLAAAYEQGRADEKVAQNPPNVAQAWKMAHSEPFYLPRQRKVEWQEWNPRTDPDPRLKSMTEDEVAQLGRALACTRAL